MTAALRDLGERVTGQVLDETAWQREDTIRAAHPARHVVGTVVAIYTHAPRVVGVSTATGEAVTIKVARP